ncbi:MAG: hypothetical protein WCI45_01015 [Desulfuromonadales bacterium]
MPKGILFSLAFLVCTMIYSTASAAAKRPPEVWNYYHFDGVAFTSGSAVDGSAFIAVREKTRPVVLTIETSPSESTPIPEGSGVIAGICYLQSTGGKLGSGSGFKSYPRVPLLISTAGKPFVTVQTDDLGYFVVVLPAATYTVGSGPATAEISVEPGITTLVPLRVGKRMAD